MFWCRKDGKGECKLTLKNLLGSGKKARIEMNDGLLFIDEIIGLVTESGTDYAVFAQRERVALSSIELVEVAVA